jgi:galactose oxidase-like protein
MKTRIVLLLLLIGADRFSIALAQSPGTFRATGDLTSGRFLHTATLLADGRVLIAGGRMIAGANPDDLKTLASAELYDPRTGSFTATGSMRTLRDGHTATLLPDSRVLIAGGWPRDAVSGGHSSASAEIYDPSAGTFTPTGDLTEGRSYHTATLLNGGRVLIAGGTSPGGILASAELYDPSTGTFTPTGNMTRPWADTATLLPSGKVLITRGNPQGPGPYLSSADLYDPSTGTFTSVGYLNVNHTAPTAVLLTSGKVLIAGGDVGDGDGASVIAELYDPATGIFSNTGNLTMGREQHTATLLPDGTVLFAGGHSRPALAMKSELYDPIQGTFSSTGDMTNGRELQTATLLRNGQVLITGGDDQRYWIPETILSSAELYTPQVSVAAPVLFSLSGDGKGQGAILHANTPQLASFDNPAAVGEALEIYLTGLGDGSLIPPQVSIGGRMAEVLWFGNTPAYAGLNQINVRVPAGVAPGPAVPVRLTYIGRPSNEVTIGVR